MDEREKKIRQRLKDDYTHYAAKCLKIRTKPGNIIPFVLNRAQQYLHDRIEDQKRRTGKVRAIVLKGRQQGCSSYIEGRFFWHVTHEEGVRAFILTHDSDATANLFEMAKRFYHNCPPVVRPHLQASNAKELLFGDLDSGYKIGTAGNKSVGRSSTIQYLHACLAEGSRIYDPMTGGFKHIESFMVGDHVLTHKGNIAPVTYISSAKKLCLSVKLRTVTTMPLVATGEHKVWTKVGWRQLGELKVNDEIGYPIKEIKAQIARLIIPESLMRDHGGGRQFKGPNEIKVDYPLGFIVGLYLAQGHIKKQAYSPFNVCYVSFSVHRKEVARTVEWLIPFRAYYSSLKIKDHKESLTSVVTVYGSRFSMFMNQLCGRTTQKHVPLQWSLLGKDFCRGLLHGYLSGDESSYGDSRKISAPSICHTLTVSIRDICASLGYGWASILYKPGANRHGRNEKTQYTFTLCGDGAYTLAKEIGKDSLKRIRKKGTSCHGPYAAKTTEISNGYAWLRIREINPGGENQVYDFEIGHEDHSYCVVQCAVSNSEVAYWANANEHAKGIMQAVPNERGTEIFFESTANGVANYFHEQWQKAESQASGFIPIFIPWYWQEEYAVGVKEGFSLTDEEKDLASLYQLSQAQLHWRRIKIVELSGTGADGIKAFSQEYPFTSPEAFILTGDDSFIPPAIVMHARKSKPEGVGKLIIGVDPARFGDDRTSIIRRQGRLAYQLQSYQKKDTMEVVGLVHQIIQQEHPWRVCIDIAGLGAGIYDRLRELGHGDVIFPVNGGNTPLDGLKYFNKRAELWGEMKEWLLEEPVGIPDSDSLHADLCGLRYKIDSRSRLLLEKKEELKKRGLRSCDEADALSLTFACPMSAADSSIEKTDTIMAQMTAQMTRQAQMRTHR